MIDNPALGITNRGRAAVTIMRVAELDSEIPLHYRAVDALDAAGLLMPDLPAANDTGIFAPHGKGWLLGGPDGPVVWTAPGGLVMVQRVEPGDLTPDNARFLAYSLLAAADYAERNTK